MALSFFVSKWYNIYSNREERHTMKKSFIIILSLFILLSTGCGIGKIDVEDSPQESKEYIIAVADEEALLVEEQLSKSERVEIMSKMIFSGFAFDLDEEWELEFKTKCESKINPDDYFVCVADLYTNSFKTFISKKRSECIRKYIETVLSISFDNEQSAFEHLVDEYETSQDERLLILIYEYLRNIPDERQKLHELRIYYYTKYFENFWSKEVHKEASKAQYQQAGCLLDSMALYSEAEQRIQCMRDIVDKCPFNDIKLEMLLYQGGNIINDYQQKRISIKDMHNHIDYLDSNLEEYVEYSDGSYETIIYVLAVRFDYEEIENEYYTKMVELYGEKQAEKLKQQAA